MRKQPRLLLRAEHRRLRMHRSPIELLGAIPIGLIGSVLPGIEHRKTGQLPISDIAIQLHVRTDRHGTNSQRLIFIIGLISIGAPKCKLARIDPQLLGDQTRTIVVEFMIVPYHQPWRISMSGLELLVGLVQTIAIAVIIQADDLRTVVLAQRTPTRCPLIDVIPQMQNQIELFADHVLVSRE